MCILANRDVMPCEWGMMSRLKLVRPLVWPSNDVENCLWWICC